MENLNPVLLALIAAIGSWLATEFGSSFVFLCKTINKKAIDIRLDISLG
ncbi:MAG TPA: hypothetical protein PLE16_04325 [Spirochaetota bacterium]|nr:hypothetical protein [Spirochaetota bacterium]HPJ15190.1 hypothetical protein [Spirochaetota bacterium]HPM33807.1 hypothetical protein [Spirochaetota bacterium]HPW51525.1 hypothetical protein [Spirochaetota bacterium]HQO21884.1 hypothetical protein [Spirochaetota bacterium]